MLQLDLRKTSPMSPVLSPMVPGPHKSPPGRRVNFSSTFRLGTPHLAASADRKSPVTRASVGGR